MYAQSEAKDRQTDRQTDSKLRLFYYVTNCCYFCALIYCWSYKPSVEYVNHALATFNSVTVDF